MKITFPMDRRRSPFGKDDFDSVKVDSDVYMHACGHVDRAASSTRSAAAARKRVAACGQFLRSARRLSLEICNRNRNRTVSVARALFTFHVSPFFPPRSGVFPRSVLVLQVFGSSTAAVN